MLMRARPRARRSDRSGPATRRRYTIRTAAPVRDLGFIDLVAAVVGRRETRRVANGAIDVDHATADAADQVMVVVADTVFVACRRAGRLNAADQALGDQHAERVVHGLQRDGADLGSYDLGDGICGDVRLTGHGAEDGQSLRRDLNSTLSKGISRVDGHLGMLDQRME